MSNKKDEALLRALETLEFFKELSLSMREIERAEESITAIRSALAEQPAQQWNPNDHYKDGWRDGMLAAQQEPVAWMHEWADGEKIPLLARRDQRDTDRPISIRPLVYADTSPQPSKPLTDERRKEIINKSWNDYLRGKDDGTWFSWHLSFDIEAAHGIKGDRND